MKAISKILVPIQFSNASKHLLQTSIDLASKTGASLYIYHFANMSDISFKKLPDATNQKQSEVEMIANQLDQKMNHLLAFIKEFDLKDVEFQSGIKFSKIRVGVPKVVEEFDIDLAVMPKPNKFNLLGFISGNAMLQMVNKLSCPCLMINKNVKKLDVKNILIPPYLEKSRNAQIIEEILEMYAPAVHLMGIAEEKAKSNATVLWFNSLCYKMGLAGSVKKTSEANIKIENISENKSIDLVVLKSNSTDKTRNTLLENIFKNQTSPLDVPVLAL